MVSEHGEDTSEGIRKDSPVAIIFAFEVIAVRHLGRQYGWDHSRAGPGRYGAAAEPGQRIIIRVFCCDGQ